MKKGKGKYLGLGKKNYSIFFLETAIDLGFNAIESKEILEVHLQSLKKQYSLKKNKDGQHH